MPVTLISNILQQNRQTNVSNDSFFHLLDTSNINFNVNGIQTDNTLVPVLTLDNKYIIKTLKKSKLQE